MEELERHMANEKEPVEHKSDESDEDNEDIELTPGTSYILDGKFVIETVVNFEANAVVNSDHNGKDGAMDIDGMEENNFDEPELEYNDEN
jgi:hypothetical protein